MNDGACKDDQEAGARVSIENKQRVVTDAKPRQTTYAKRRKSVHRETSVSMRRNLIARKAVSIRTAQFVSPGS